MTNLPRVLVPDELDTVERDHLDAEEVVEREAHEALVSSKGSPQLAPPGLEIHVGFRDLNARRGQGQVQT